eukprot:6182255-Pleurochrysis_carterae.AAC.3
MLMCASRNPPTHLRAHAQARKVLGRFWGRARWARNRLCKVAYKNHRKRFGLYRAKETRFAGQYRALERLLRLKGDLKEVVVSDDYESQNFATRMTHDDDDHHDNDDDDDSVDPQLKAIILDDNFRKEVGQVLKILLEKSHANTAPLTPRLCGPLPVATPIIQLLRLMDGNMPCMGKIHDRMFAIGQAFNDSSVPWKDHSYKIRDMDRWKYLHPPFHAAGYALDLEFLDTEGNTDKAMQTGLIEVVERLCLLERLLNAPDLDARLCTFSVDDVDVQETMRALAMKQSMQYREREDIITNESVMLIAKVMAPATCWWSTYIKHLTLIAKIAQVLLAQPVAASAASRVELVYLRADQVEDAQQAWARGGRQVCVLSRSAPLAPEAAVVQELHPSSGSLGQARQRRQHRRRRQRR